MSNTMSKFRITVDTGGTFTDVVYYDEGQREITILNSRTVARSAGSS